MISQMGTLVCWALAFMAMHLPVNKMYVVARNVSDTNQSGEEVATLAVFRDPPSSTSNLVLLPNASPSFQAGVIRATQLSFNEAPDRYPFIHEQILNATHAAATTALPYKDSNNLDQCVVPKWQAFGNSTATIRTVEFINGSLRTNITSSGLVSSADARVNFSVPVWMGGCAWQQFVSAYNKDPSKYPQVVDYLNQGLTQAEHQMSFPDQGGHCPDMLSEAIPKLMSYWDVVDHTNVSLRQRRHHHHHCDTTPTCNIHGSQAHKQLTYVPNTLKMAIGADNASTVVSAQIHVQVSVPFEIHGCKKGFFGHCECKTVCGGGSTMVESFTMQMTMNTPCKICPMPPAVTPSAAQVTTTILGTPSVQFHGCGKYFNKYQGKASGIIQSKTESELGAYISKNKDKIPAVFCACATVCPHPPSTVDGSFIMTITSPIRADVVDGVFTVVGANATVKYSEWSNFRVCKGADPNFYGYGDEVRDLVVNNTELAITQYVANQTRTWGAPTTFEPFPPYPINITYGVEDVEYSPRAWIDGAVRATVTGRDNVTGKVYTYTDVYPPDAVMLPPNVTWSPPTSASGAALFDDVRISSTTMTGLLTVGNLLGYFKYNSTALILDAGLRLNVTFEEPEVSVPSSNLLTVFLPRGRIVVTCMNDTSKPPLFDFEFTSVTANGFVTYVTAPTAGFTVTLTSFDLDHTTLTLFRPNIPLPNEILVALLRRATLDSIPTTNKWFSLHPFVLPTSIARLIPKPSLNLEPQPGCCNPPSGSGGWQHGFLDATSYDDAHQHPGPATPIEREEERRSERLPDEHSAVIPSMRPTAEPRGVCSTDAGLEKGDMMAVLFSNSSSGLCEVGAAGSFFLTQNIIADGQCSPLWERPADDATLFYSFEYGNISSFFVSESPFCDNVSLVAIPVNDTGECIPLLANTVGIGSIMLLPSGATPACTSRTTEQNTAIVEIFESADACAAGQSADVFIAVSTVASTSCHGSDDDDKANSMPFDIGEYRVWNASAHSSGFGAIGLDCGPTCSTCELMVVGFDQCASFENITANTSMSVQITPVSSIPIFRPNAHHSTLSNKHVVGITLGILCSALAIAASVWLVRHWVRTGCWKIWCDRCRERVSSCQSCTAHAKDKFAERTCQCLGDVKGCCIDFGGVLKKGAKGVHEACVCCGGAIARLVVRLAKFLWGEISAVPTLVHKFLFPPYKDNEVQNADIQLQTFALLAASTLLMGIHALLWETKHPFNVFSDGVFKKVGLSSQYLQAPAIHTHFQQWGEVGMLMASVNTLLLAWTALRCFIFPRWNRLAPIYVQGILCLHFGSLLLPPFFFKFSDGFVLSDSSSELVTQDSQFRSSVESSIGTAFSTAAFNWYATIFVYTLHAVPPAVFCSSAAFWYQRSYTPGDDSQGENGRVRVNHREHEWVFIAGRIKVLLWLVHLLCPFSGLLGVIVLYQTGGATSNAGWASCWLLIWVLPMCILAAWGYGFPREGPRNPRRFVIYVGTYVIVYVILLGYLVAGQIGVDHNVDASFLITCTVSTSMLIMAVIFIIFHQERVKDDECFEQGGDVALEVVVGANASDDQGGGSGQQSRRARRWSMCPTCLFENKCWGRLKRFVLETNEHIEPHVYGKRLPYRRVFLIVSLGTMGAVLWKMTWHDLTTSAFDDFKDTLAKLGYHIDWPQGGSMFDSLFRTYQHTRIASDALLFGGWCLLLIALIIEPVLQCVRRGRFKYVALMWSRTFVGAALAVMFIGVILPATPNYLAESGLETSCPLKCTPQFDVFVQTLLRNMVGLACTGLFASHLVVLLLAVPVAMVRVSTLILCDKYFDKSFPHFEEGAKKVYIRNVLMIFGWGASLAPLLCCLPMLMMYQFFGDTVMGACIAVFACVPPLIAFVTTFEHINKCYFLYLVAYFAPLITILAYEAHKHTLTDAVVRQLRDPMTYVELVAEIFLSNVMVSDICYAQFFVRQANAGQQNQQAVPARPLSAPRGIAVPLRARNH